MFSHARVMVHDNDASFSNVNLPITNGIVSSKFYDKQDDFNFKASHYLDGDVSRSSSYGVYISHVICF